jgi:hypothetical protein
MSATMARQGGRVQLEQSDMCLALNMAKMAKEGFSRAAREETKYLIKKPRAEVGDEQKRGVEFQTPPPPGTPPAPTGNISGAQTSEIVNMAAGYMCMRTAFPFGEFFDDGEKTEHDTYFDPDMLTDEGKHTICCVVMRLRLILKSKAAD